MRAVKVICGLVMLGGVLLAASAALGAGMPAGGVTNLFATPEGESGVHTTVLFTGAIGDHGQALTITKNGKANANGNYVKVTLTRGTFEINSTILNARANKAHPSGDSTTCSGALEVAGPVSLFDGTGLYTGISGTLTVTETFAFNAPRFASGADKGKCNTSATAQPTAVYSSIIGTGTVSFS
jgi:hypothetical protein